MLVHKRSHITPQQLQQPLNSNIFHSIKEECAQDHSAHPEPLRKNVTIPVVSMSYPSTSVSSTLDVDTVRDSVVDGTLPNHNVVVAVNDEDAIVSDSLNGKEIPPDPNQKVPHVFSLKEPRPTPIHASSSNEKAVSVPSRTTHVGAEPKNKNLMKLLATAYMNRFPPSKSENPCLKEVIPKNETIPVEITSETSGSPANFKPTSLLRSQLRNSGLKTKSSTVAKILDSSKKSIVSLTQTFSPVVLLETRQKLVDLSSSGTCGRYQCGRCRKVFQDVDSLTEHHFLHRKERIKCCRYCKQLIIGKLPFTDNHFCAQSAAAAQHSNAKQKTLSFVKKTATFHRLKQQSIMNKLNKVFFCSVCKHSYARRYNLKMHKCQGPASEKVQSSEMKAGDNAQVDDGSQMSKSVAVGTASAAVVGNIKVEVTPASLAHSAFSDMAWSGSPKSFLPFYAKTSKDKEPSAGESSLQQVEKQSRGTAVASQQEDNGGQWTVPLDDEMEMLESITGSANDDTESRESLSVPHVNKSQKSGLSFFLRDGAKRYPCNKCQKTYSRPSTLRRHLRLCGFKPHGIVTPQHQNSRVNNILGHISQFAAKVNPVFNCIFCGKFFNRKDNMVTHRKKCQVKRAMSVLGGSVLQHSVPGGTTKEPETQRQRQQPQDDRSNWGVMSLPSVLPRRVTCECGAGFTSPKLLLEHLQKHAQESYTCPTCGETVASWADYEVHLQIHMHPHNQLYKGLQPQRSQPLLLRFQQPPPPRKQPHPALTLPHHTLTQPYLGKKQRIICTRCNNTFSNRCNLRKHLSLNRCKGGRVTLPPKAGHCSRCNTHFPSIISLVFHQRSGACKMAVKPVRCNVCLRWFGTEDGLQKHLLTHKRPQTHKPTQTLPCDICQGMYSTIDSLKNHRRKVHRIMSGVALASPKQEN